MPSVAFHHEAKLIERSVSRTTLGVREAAFVAGCTVNQLKKRLTAGDRASQLGFKRDEVLKIGGLLSATSGGWRRVDAQGLIDSGKLGLPSFEVLVAVLNGRFNAPPPESDAAPPEPLAAAFRFIR